MLTFEWEQQEEALHVHANPTELRKLATLFNRLAEETEKKGSNHTHLYSPSWGGNDLSEERQTPTATLIQHVKIHGWAKP